MGSKISIGGVLKDATPHVFTGGVWKKAKANIHKGGKWCVAGKSGAKQTGCSGAITNVNDQK